MAATSEGFILAHGSQYYRFPIFIQFNATNASVDLIDALIHLSLSDYNLIFVHSNGFCSYPNQQQVNFYLGEVAPNPQQVML